MATRVAEEQRVGSILVVPVDPAQHRLMVARALLCNAHRTRRLRDLVESEEPFAGASVRRLEREASKVVGRLLPTDVLNSEHGRRLIPELLPKTYAFRGRRGLITNEFARNID